MYIVVVAEMAAKEARLRWGSYLTSIEIPRHEERDEKCKRYLDAAGSPDSFQAAPDGQV